MTELDLCEEQEQATAADGVHWTQVSPRTVEEHSLQALIELSAEIHTEGDLYRVAELGLLKFMGHLGTAKAALWILSRENGAPVLIRSLGIPERHALALGEICMPKIVAAVREAAAPAFVRGEAEFFAPAEAVLVRRAGIALFGTLHSSGRPLGALVLGHRVSGEPYAEPHLRVLEASLHHLGVALDNTLLYAGVREQNRELRQAREKLDELDRLKQEFLGNMHHEVRTPLNIIIGYLHMAREQESQDAETRQMLGVAQEQAEMLSGLLENLLTFRGLQDDSMLLHDLPLDPAAFLQEYFENRRPGLALGLREFTLRLPEALPAVRADPDRLRQLLDELVDNALKFTPQGSWLELRALPAERDGEEGVSVELADNGPGIPPEHLPHVHEAFRQVDGSLTREAGGLGLGLALARELAFKMGADLRLDSVVGRGTTCRLWLPRA